MTILKDIEIKLDKIIELLELRNSIERARNQMRRGTIYFDDSEVFPDRHGVEIPSILDHNTYIFKG